MTGARLAGFTIILLKLHDDCCKGALRLCNITRLYK